MKTFKIMVEVEVLASSDDAAYEIINEYLGCYHSGEVNIRPLDIKYPHSVSEITEEQFEGLSREDASQHLMELLRSGDTLSSLAFHPFEQIREFAREQLEEAV